MGTSTRSMPHLLISIVLTLASMRLLAATAPPLQTSTPPPKGKIGVAYGLNGDDLPSPKQAVALLCSKGITRVRTYEARSDVTRAFANSGIDLILGVRNEDIPTIAASVKGALTWVIDNVIPFPWSSISAIIVGNEWFLDPSNDPALLLPAMENMYTALIASSIFLPREIKVSTCHRFSVLSSSYPPSAGAFNGTIASFMAPLVKFLVETGSFFMVNIFPYFAYRDNINVSLEFALFESTQVVQDPNTGLNYTNLFDMQIDAMYAALESLMSSPACSISSPPCTTVIGKGNQHVHINGEGDQHAYVKAASLTRSNKKPPPTRLRMVTGETGWPSGAGSTGSTPPRRLSSMDHLWRLGNAPVLQRHKAQHFRGSLNLVDSPPAISSPESLSEQSSASSPSEQPSLMNVSTAPCKCEAENVQNAQAYNQNLISHVLHARGTPAHPNTPLQVYIFALFNEDLKPAGPEQHYGLFYPNGTAVYPIDFHPL